MNIDQSDPNESQSSEMQIASNHPFALYRGFSGPQYGVNHPFTNPYFGKPRQPRYLPTDKQIEIGKWFEKNFKIDYWNTALLATGSFSLAKAYAGEYGSVGILEPGNIASCSICWSPVYADPFGELESRSHIPVADLLEEGKFEVVWWQDEQRRRESIQTGHELMVMAPSFKVTKWFNP
jgi:hypothetical protein